MHIGGGGKQMIQIGVIDLQFAMCLKRTRHLSLSQNFICKVTGLELVSHDQCLN